MAVGPLSHDLYGHTSLEVRRCGTGLGLALSVHGGRDISWTHPGLGQQSLHLPSAKRGDGT